MATNQNVTQLTAQATYDTTSLFYAVGASGTTDTKLPGTVLLTNTALTGVPTAPTAATATNTTQIASTAYVQTNLGSYLTSAIAATTYAPLASPTFTGTVTIPTGASISGYAPLASPTFTGSPVVPGYLTTAAAGSTYAPLASPTFTGTVVIPTVTISGGTVNSATIGATTAASGKFTTLQATSTITPSTTSGVVGTTLADNANAGSIGEFLSNSTTGTGITSGNTVNATSLSLTAGDWDVWGQALFIPTAGSIVVGLNAGLGTVSATLPSPPAAIELGITLATGAAGTTGLNVTGTRFNVSTTTTVFLTAEANSVTVASASVNGYIFARRRR